MVTCAGYRRLTTAPNPNPIEFACIISKITMGVNKNEVKQKPAEIRRPYLGGADGTQTHDLYDANVALYQLSYNPKTGADKKTRTSKALLPLVPETSASTNSAISAGV